MTVLRLSGLECLCLKSLAELIILGEKLGAVSLLVGNCWYGLRLATCTLEFFTAMNASGECSPIASGESFDVLSFF